MSRTACICWGLCMLGVLAQSIVSEYVRRSLTDMLTIADTHDQRLALIERTLGDVPHRTAPRVTSTTFSWGDATWAAAPGPGTVTFTSTPYDVRCIPEREEAGPMAQHQERGPTTQLAIPTTTEHRGQ